MTDISWLIGGPQGSGVESAASIFSRVCAKMGWQIFAKREFYSNIKGEHSYFVVRVADKKIHSNVNDSTLMVSYDAETIFRHAEEVIKGGAIIYDSDLDAVTIDDVRTFDISYKKRLEEHMNSLGKTPTIAGILETIKENGISLYPVSFSSLLSDLAKESDNPKLKHMKRIFNIIGASLSLGLLKMPLDPLLESIELIFAKKPQVTKINKLASTHAYNLGSTFTDFDHTLFPIQKKPHTILIQGYHGTAIGKMVCGCRFQSYYPITPASDESVYLELNEILDVADNRPGSTLVVQTEDEICAIGMAIGGAVTGTRCATCTSGPGFSLMAEMLGWAGINEVPVVITNYQRSGPSTGLPTRHGQDDLLFAINVGHGEFPKIVYASGDVEESFYDVAKCFNFAEIYQLPVIHLMDKFQASSIVTCPRFDPDKIVINRGKLLEKITTNDYKRFELTDDGISPRSKLGLKNGIFWNTGDESDEYGHISEDPIIRVKMMDKRFNKLAKILKDVPDIDQIVSFGVAKYTIVSWGSAKGPILDAIQILKKENIDVGFVQIKLLNPFPTDYLKFLLQDAQIIINVEANQTGQLGKIIQQNLMIEPDYHILKYTGRAMTSTEVYDSLKKIITGTAKKKEVLMYGA